MKDNNKEVKKSSNILSQKNILIVALIVLALVLVVLYINTYRQNQEKEKLSTSYLIDSGTINLQITNLEEVSQILSEAPSEYFVLITYTGSEDTYELEEGLKTIIDEYQLNDLFYYVDVTSITSEDNYLTRINNAFDTDIIETIPVIIYYKDGEIIDTVKRYDDNVINAADFQKLLDIYEYEVLD